VESRLLLVSVLRRVGRFQLATKELELLEGMDEARPWSLELSRERERLRCDQESDHPESGNPESENQESVSQLRVSSVQETDPLGEEQLGEDLDATSARELLTQLGHSLAVPDPSSVSSLDEMSEAADAAAENARGFQVNELQQNVLQQRELDRSEPERGSSARRAA
jgi:hypothetical protein